MTVATLMETAKAWLSIGGRILIFPDGRVDGALSAEHLLSLKLAPAEAERRMTIAKAYNAAPRGVLMQAIVEAMFVV